MIILRSIREGGWLKTRGRQRTDSRRVIEAVRDLAWLELVGETLRQALNAVAPVAPTGLQLAFACRHR
jgi:transposase